MNSTLGCSSKKEEVLSLWSIRTTVLKSVSVLSNFSYSISTSVQPRMYTLLLHLFVLYVRFASSATIPSTSPQQAVIVANGDVDVNHAQIPTIEESAALARRILRGQSIGILSTIFPSSTPEPSTSYHRPSASDLAGLPIGLPDYYAADCESSTHPGDPTLLALSIATSFRNVRDGSNVSLTVTASGWHKTSRTPSGQDIVSPGKSDDGHGWENGPASQPRFSLIGTIERLTEEEVRGSRVENCFLERHPDAEAWLPGNEVHESWWARLKVGEVYWVGGFGDRAFIGWIPVDVWRSGG